MLRGRILPLSLARITIKQREIVLGGCSHWLLVQTSCPIVETRLRTRKRALSGSPVMIWVDGVGQIFLERS